MLKVNLTYTYYLNEQRNRLMSLTTEGCLSECSLVNPGPSEVLRMAKGQGPEPGPPLLTRFSLYQYSNSLAEKPPIFCTILAAYSMQNGLGLWKQSSQ